MAAVSIQAQVVELVVEATAVKPENVLLTTRLLDDLGMDGDDAVEFFNRVHERFGTDLTHLHSRWREHFGPEALPCTAVPVIALAAVVGGLVGSVAGPIAGTATAVAALAASVWALPKLGLVDKMTPITVAEVVSAVEAGSWPPLA
jgi:acyl carrier protein